MNAQGLRVRAVVVFACVFANALGPAFGGDESGTIKPGRYVPKLHGADRGKYVPDLSGIYRHKKLPYDGGYGDRGLKYTHRPYSVGDAPPERPQFDGPPTQLGPEDHLRFMIDFNFNDSGWRIVQFEWVRDGAEDHQYHYVNENKLWSDEHASPVSSVNTEAPIYYSADAVDGDEVAVTDAMDSDLQAVHVEGEYNDSAYNVAYTNDAPADNKHNTQGVRQAIKEILDYIQRVILPTLP